MRRFNVTRLQIGVQHIDDEILQEIRVVAAIKDTIKGNNLWKRNGGKIDWRLMPDLPGSSKEKTFKCFSEEIFGVNSITEVSDNYFKYELKRPELQADQLKSIRPCEVVDYTKIKEWYENGTYKPYGENESELIEVITFIKRKICSPWIRINRKS